MIIDFHVHCFPDSLASRAVAELAQCSDIKPWIDGTVEGIKESMKRAGISKSVVLSIATKPSQVEKINLWAKSILEEDIIPFGSIHPLYEDYKNELRRIKEYGLKGIKFHPDYQGFFVDDENMFPIYEAAFELGLVVVFHAGLDIGLPEPYHATPQRLSKVAEAFKGQGCKIIAAHMGGFSYWDDVERFLTGSDIYLDTSYTLGYIGNDQFLRIVKNHGAQKIIFGTDSPWGGQQEEILKLRNMGLGEEDEICILGLNGGKLLGI